MGAPPASPVMAEIAACLPRLPLDSVPRFAGALLGAPRFYIHGVGRCGLLMRGFAVRAAQLALPVAVVGEPGTTAAAAGDLVVVGSGSGATPTAVAIAEAGRRAGARVLGLTAVADAPLARVADECILIPGVAKTGLGGDVSAQPPGSLFEQMLFLFLEETVLDLARRLDPGFALIRRRHANLE